MTAVHKDHAKKVRERPLAQSLNTVTAPSCPGSQCRHTAVPHGYFLEVNFLKSQAISLLQFLQVMKKDQPEKQEPSFASEASALKYIKCYKQILQVVRTS